MSPGRIRSADLPPELRRKLVGRAARPAPVRTRPTIQPRPDMFCLSCGLHSDSEAAAERHAADTRHYRYTDLGLGL